ncbi:hypothetical protein Tco_0181552, partial [Tanacetum coccineum]
RHSAIMWELALGSRKFAKLLSISILMVALSPGVPLKLWTLNTFKRIVTMWGNLIDTNDSDGNCFHSKRLCLFTKSISNIYENFKIIFRGRKVYWICAKEVPGWTPDLVEDSDEEELSDDDSLEEGMKNLESENDCSNSFEVPDMVFENEGGSKKDRRQLNVYIKQV